MHPAHDEPILRCTVCGWSGPRSAAVFRAAQPTGRLCCPVCAEPCRAVDLIRPDAPTAEFLALPRVCTSCGFAGVNGDFGITTAHGRRMVRSKCPACMKRYFQQRYLARCRSVAAGGGT